MPVINGVYLKDFPALPSSVVDANIIPIAESGNQVAYRTTVGGIVTDARVTGKVLTGLSVTGGAIASTDTILQAFGKVQNQLNNRVTSVGLSMPSAFTVTNSPVTGSGTLTVTGAGLASQYIRGDGQLADFPTGGGGGSSVSYYLNGSVNQGTFVGNTYYEMNKTPVLGAGTDFNIAADGYIAQFITDANDPNSLLIPGGNWNLEFYFSASSGGGTPSFYVELSKWNGSSFTAIASNSSNPELIAFGTSIQPYFATLAVPETVLLATDRLAIRIYVNHSGRTITLHTENNHLCQIITTFTTGLQSLNGLTKQAQFFSVGTSGTDFNISSSVATHTFNIPSASDSNRGLVTTGTQTFAGEKTFFNGLKSLNTLRVDLSSTPNTTGLHSNTSGNGAALYAQADTGNAAWLYNFGTGNAVLKVEVGNLTGALATFNNTGGQVVLISNAGNITANSFIKSGGTSSQFLKADGSVDGTAYGTGSVTSVSALTLGTSGTDLSSTVANGTTTPVITLNVPTASSTNRGALSSTDWTTFNSKQNAITLTTVGTSGAATLVGSTLNIPNYADGGVLSLSAIGSSPNANGGTITGTVLNLEPASASFGGVVTTGTQTFAGDKTFTGIITQTVGTSESKLTTTAGSGLEIRSDGSTAADRNIAFKLGTTVQGQIYNSGNWFIGSSPTDAGYKLDVNGTGRFKASAATYAGGSLILTSSSGTNPIYLTSNGGYFALSNGGGGDHLLIASTGAATFSSTTTASAFIPSGASVPTNGLFLPATNAIGFATNTTERMRITSGGNVGINTTSPKLNANNGTFLTVLGTSASSWLELATDSTTDGNGGLISFNNTNIVGSDKRVASIYGIRDGANNSAYIGFSTNNAGTSAERMRITSGGFTKISNTGTYVNSAGTYHELYSSISNSNVAYFTNGASSNPYGPLIYFSAAAPNDATRYFLSCQDNTAERATIRSNGGLANYSANDVNLSDERVKKDIIPLESYWDKFKAIEIVKFKYKDQIHDDFNIGVIAQQVEAVAPEFVDIDGWGNKPKLDEEGNEIINDEEPLKSIYTADLYHATIKVLQECMSKIEELKAEIDILKNK